MPNLSARAAARLVLIVSCLTVPVAALWAQNENETVGFQSNHAFDSTHFGENIDILNGNLSLTVPIGPSYQVNHNFGYQLSLSYNSKVWDTARYTEQGGGVDLSRRSAAGLGFSMNLGRIYRDVQTRGGHNWYAWYYVSPDGNEHDLGVASETQGGCTKPPRTITNDNTFVIVAGTPVSYYVRTPDGLRYTLNHLVQVRTNNSDFNTDNGCVSGIIDPKAREFNRDFGGWYVTLIEDTKSDWGTVSNTSHSPRHGQSGFTSWVEITYEDEPPGSLAKKGHAIKSILDSTERQIDFTNACEPDPSTASQCKEPTGYPDPARMSVRTTGISLPAFKGSLTPDVPDDPANPNPSRTVATYTFNYTYSSLACLSTPCNGGSANVLTSILYPAYDTHSATSVHDIAISFSYYTNGELQGRILPTGASFAYTWDSYSYLDLNSGQGGNMGGGLTRYTRQLVYKSLSLPGDGHLYSWQYARDAGPSGTYFTNPKNVRVTGPIITGGTIGNDTVYYYRASLPSLNTTTPPQGPPVDDGFAPEWDDGLNYRIEYYQGTGAGRKLIRSETRDYNYNISGDDPTIKEDVRMNRAVTIHNDAGGRSATVAYTNWDGMGHWKTTTETGDGIAGTRRTSVAYLDRDPSHVVYKEVSDGQKVLGRIDNSFVTRQDNPDSWPRLGSSIQRSVLPPLGSPANSTPLVGDITTCYAYDAFGNVSLTAVTDQASCSTNSAVTDSRRYLMRYTWQAGGYLAAKELYDRDSNAYFPWKAINRSRDGNTGLIFESYDSAGVKTTYGYDRLGRLRDIDAPSTEWDTQIQYEDITHTTVRQGDSNGLGSNYSCLAPPSGEYIMGCYEYDSLGRLVTTRRGWVNSDNKMPYRTTSYNIQGWKAFESEWMWPGDAQVGTTFDYRDPGTVNLPPAQQELDAFGRVRTVTTSDGKVATTTYLGPDTTVTVKDVQGVSGTFDAPTAYHRDTWDHLTRVETAATGGADALYTYDLRDNLLQVDLVSKAKEKQTRYFEYDTLGRLRSATNPENGTVVVTGYDSLGNVTEEVDASGNHLISEYDGAGRLKTVKRLEYQKPGAPAPTAKLLITNTYDAAGGCSSGTGYGCSAGRLTAVEERDETGSTVIHREDIYYLGLNGRVASESHTYNDWTTTAPALTYTYNSFGLAEQITYPEGVTGLGASFKVKYTYKNGIPVTVSNDSPTVDYATATYNAAGGFKTINTLGGVGGVTTQIDTDSQNRPASIRIGQGGSNYYDSGPYAYDGAGNISAIGSNSYGYDAAGRLVQAIDQYDTYRKQTYIYDDFGNMREKHQYDAASTETVRDIFSICCQTDKTTNNRIFDLLQLGDGHSRLFSFDERGNLTLSDTQSGVMAFAYDSRNRMSSSRLLSGVQALDLATYTYDASANRVRKVEPPRDLSTFYVRDGQGRVMSEFRRTRFGTYTPEWSKHYVYLGGRLVALRETPRPNPPGGLGIWWPNSQGNITLHWKKNPEDSVTAYRVYKSSSGGAFIPFYPDVGASTACSNDATSVCYTDLTNVAGTQYQYQVTAISGTLESYGSDIIIVTAGDVTPPSPPTCLTGTAGDRQVSLSWTASPSPDVIGYNIYRKRCAFCAIEWITWTLVTGTTYVDSGLVNGSNITYWIRAQDSASNNSGDVVNTGCNPPLSSPFTAMPKDYVAPAPPRGLSAAGDCSVASTIDVSWAANASTDAVTHYYLYRNSDPPIDRGTATSYTDTATVAGTAYYYYVIAQDANGNNSAPSLQASVSARSSSVAVPAPPSAQGGNGQVSLKVTVPTGSSSIQSLRVYRKLNSNSACGSYELITSVSALGVCSIATGTPCVTDTACPAGQSCVFTWNSIGYRDLVDPAAPNNAAYDYATTQIDNHGWESAYSSSDIGIPLAPPVAYRECVEYRGASYVPGSISCATDDWRRLVARWDAPLATPYQPLSATNSNQTVGYLKGYHVYQYTYQSATPDISTLEPLRIDSVKTYCPTYPDVSCADNTGCPNGEACNGAAPAASGFCGTNPCMMSSDCASTTCVTPPTDPYLVKFGDAKIYWSQPISGNSCLVSKAVYKIFVNGNWQTLESDFSDNYDARQFSQPADRCINDSLNPCGGLNSPPAACPTPNSLAVTPAIPGAPTVDTSGGVGSVTVRWSAPDGICQFDQPLNCTSNDTCSNNGETCDKQTHLCQPTNPAYCQVSQNCPATSHTQKCVGRSGSVAGYRIYGTEVDKYHFVHPLQYVSVGSGQLSYMFSGFSYWSKVYFRVATVDQQGRISDPSAPSTVVTWTPPANLLVPPASLKTVVWTSNDAISWQTRDVDGIKLAWRRAGNFSDIAANPDFKGYIIWRSSTSGGPVYCALLKQGSGNPVDATLCTNETDGTVGDPNAGTAATIVSSSTVKQIYYVDKTVKQNVPYYYVVTAVMTAGRSANSSEVSGMALGHAQQPLSPPTFFKAWAPNYNFSHIPVATLPEYLGIYLRWCPNPAAEGVTTKYTIYRSYQSSITDPSTRGPYAKLADIPLACLDGSHRCEIVTVGVTPTAQSCTATGINGTCKVIDKSVTQNENGIYYYKVTAWQGNGNKESGTSAENMGWPNKNPPYCTILSDPAYKTCYPRYDPDNFPDIPCGDEDASLAHPGPRVAEVVDQPPNGSPDLVAVSESDDPAAMNAPEVTALMAPYRTIGGGRIGNGGGGGGGGAVPASITPRMLFYHLDHLGSPRVITDDTGAILRNSSGVEVGKHHYMPFGEELPLVAQGSNNTRQFTGHERDSESGLDYMLARYYSSALARFAVSDTLGGTHLRLPQSWNAYSYVQNNPLTLVDQDGQEPSITPTRITRVPILGNTIGEAQANTILYFSKWSTEKDEQWMAAFFPNLHYVVQEIEIHATGDSQYTATNTSVLVTLKPEIKLPRWLGTPDTPGGQVEEFESHVQNVSTPHEYRHQQVAIQGARMLDAKLRKIKGEGKTAAEADADRAAKTKKARDDVDRWMDNENYAIDHPGVISSGYYGGDGSVLIVDGVDVTDPVQRH